MNVGKELQIALDAHSFENSLNFVLGIVHVLRLQPTLSANAQAGLEHHLSNSSRSFRRLPRDRGP
jgi:hypothetical protein